MKIFALLALLLNLPNAFAMNEGVLDFEAKFNNLITLIDTYKLASGNIQPWIKRANDLIKENGFVEETLLKLYEPILPKREEVIRISIAENGPKLLIPMPYMLCISKEAADGYWESLHILKNLLINFEQWEEALCRLAQDPDKQKVYSYLIKERDLLKSLMAQDPEATPES